MKKIIILYILFIVIIAFVLCFIFKMVSTNIIIDLYTNNVRGTLFTAFLATGSFTLSLISMFMFSFKANLFDDDDYKKLYFAKQKIKFENISIYDPLVNIARLFLFCIFCCFLTSLTQFTLGLIKNIYVIAFCLALSLCTIFLALIILYNVWRNFEVWFDILLKKKITNSSK